MGARAQIPDRRAGHLGLNALAGEPGMTAARRYVAVSRPRSPALHLLDGGERRHLFVADGSRLFQIGADAYAALDNAVAGGNGEEALAGLGLAGPPAIDDAPPPAPPVHALSLAVAQKCNLGCLYCYAQQGDFGGAAKDMPLATAERAIDLLLAEAARGSGRANLAFLGGEPLVNRPVLQAATRRAADLAHRAGILLSFSITTNGTLLGTEDAEFFEEFGFAVTISLDGPAAAHDRLRPFKGGRGSFATIMRNVRPLLALQRRMQVSARVTVTPENLMLRDTLDGLIAEGFHSVGFSPMLSAPSGYGEMQARHLEAMLGRMIECGREFERRLAAGERYPFANMVNALREIHRGTHRPYPCGAGAGYLGVSADGELAACHRFVGDEDGAMGSVAAGIDRERQARWLDARHVHRQEPCQSCWARYLCGGGCHHEAIRRGRPACDYIRGWLHYCLEAYLRLAASRPDWFAPETPWAPNAK
jgi:uncharacterized protein